MTDPRCPNCGKSILECQGFCPKKGMREKIAKMLVDYAPNKGYEDDLEAADQILSLTHDEWEMVEECEHEKDKLNDKGCCPFCNGTGKLTRPATINEALNGRARRKG